MLPLQGREEVILVLRHIFLRHQMRFTWQHLREINSGYHNKGNLLAGFPAQKDRRNAINGGIIKKGFFT
jgi:hypothetical protein